VSRTRLNPRLAKLHRSYTVEEVARLYGLHRNTVRAWLKGGGLAAIDGGRPVLVQGKTLRGFLEARRTGAKRPCSPGTLYCLRCRQPRQPALGMVDFIARPAGAGNLRALCETCGAPMNRRARWSTVSEVLPGIEVRVMGDPPRIAEREPLSVKRA
jgi:excisionase family DNA binding protein